MRISCIKLRHFACFALLLTGVGTAFDARAETLEQAVQAALNNHPSVTAAIANRDALAQDEREKWAGFFPDLNVRAAGGRIYGDNATSRGLQVTRDSAYSNLWEGAVTLTQPIFDGFDTKNRVSAAGARHLSANYDITDLREQLALRTTVAYLDIVRLQEKHGRLRDHEQKIADYTRRIQSMVDEGAADESMIIQSRDIALQLEDMVNDAAGQLNAAIATYAELVGYMPERTLDMPYPATHLLPGNVLDAVENALRDHPALAAARNNERANHYEREADRQFYYPDINGELSYLKRDQKEEIGGDATDAKAVLRLNWDISLAGGQVARARKATARVHESRAREAELRRQIERDIRIAYSDINTAARQTELQRERVGVMNDLFATYETQFEAARINLLQLLQADNRRFKTSLDLLDHEFSLVTARFSALASMGLLQDSLNIVAARSDARSDAR